RLVLYDKFVDKWFERAKERLEQKSTHDTKAFNDLCRHFTKSCLQFSMQLAVKLYKNPAYKGVVDCSTPDSEHEWLDSFKWEQNTTKLLLQECCPLKCNDLHYSFLHKSLLEYFTAHAIIEATKAQNTKNKHQEETMSLLTKTNLVNDPAAQ